MRPLDGIRVLDLSTMVSGPLATAVLADQGADVIKVEAPGGDALRHIGARRAGVSAIFQTLNRGKRSLCVDLKTDAGRALLMRLIATADVFVENFRPGVAERMGLGAESLRAEHASLVHASIRGFGDAGPYADRRVYDIVVQGLSGMAASQAAPDGAPVLVRTIVCDKITAIHAAQAITAALLARERGQGGTRLSISMLDASVSFLWPDIVQAHTYVGALPVESGPSLTSTVRLYRARDGWITMLALTDAHFAGLLRALELPELATDSRFRDSAGRALHFDDLHGQLEAATCGLDVETLTARLATEGVPGGPVLRPEELHDNAQVRANGLLEELEDARFGTVRMPGAVACFGGQREPLSGLAPQLNEHEAEILAELHA